MKFDDFMVIKKALDCGKINLLYKGFEVIALNCDAKYYIEFFYGDSFNDKYIKLERLKKSDFTFYELREIEFDQILGLF